MIPEFYQRKIKTLAMDCTEHCNARCVFCFNDWRHLKPAEMDTYDFERILPLIPLTEKNGFYLSCLFEPTINPQFFEMLKMLPEEARKHTFFTTNLVKSLTDQELETMCQANVDHINLSLETFDPALYSKLSGIRQSAFYDNLKRLGRIAQTCGTHIRLITLMMQDNYEELPKILEKAHVLVHPYQHEFRTPIYTHGDPERERATEEQLLSAAGLEFMKKKLEAYGYNTVFDLTWNRGFYLKWKQERIAAAHKPKPDRLPTYIFRLYADGHGVIEDLDRKFQWREIPDLKEYCENALEEVKRLEDQKIQQNFIRNIRRSPRLLETVKSNVDELTVMDRSWIYIRGWGFDESGAHADNERVFLVENGRHRYACRLTSCDRPDVIAVYKEKASGSCGFHGKLPITGLDRKKAITIAIGWPGRFHFDAAKLITIRPEQWPKA